MNEFKIMINSSPRSGTAWLQTCIVNALGLSLKQENLDHEWYDRHLSRSNTPEMLLGKFPNGVVQSTIIRNPLDIIPSIITKTYGGLGNTVTLGISMPHEYTQMPSKINFINGQIKVAKKYVEYTTKNVDNLFAFTFEDVTKDVQSVVDRIFKELELDIVSLGDVNKLIELAKENIETFKYEHPGHNNPLPIEQKPDIYYEIKDMVRHGEGFDHLMYLYDQCVDKINDRWKK